MKPDELAFLLCFVGLMVIAGWLFKKKTEPIPLSLVGLRFFLKHRGLTLPIDPNEGCCRYTTDLFGSVKDDDPAITTVRETLALLGATEAEQVTPDCHVFVFGSRFSSGTVLVGVIPPGQSDVFSLVGARNPTELNLATYDFRERVIHYATILPAFLSGLMAGTVDSAPSQ